MRLILVVLAVLLLMGFVGSGCQTVSPRQQVLMQREAFNGTLTAMLVLRQNNKLSDEQYLYATQLFDAGLQLLEGMDEALASGDNLTLDIYLQTMQRILDNMLLMRTVAEKAETPKSLKGGG